MKDYLLDFKERPLEDQRRETAYTGSGTEEISGQDGSPCHLTVREPLPCSTLPL